MPRAVAALLTVLLILPAMLLVPQPAAGAPPTEGKQSTESVVTYAPDRVIVGVRDARKADGVQQAHGLSRASQVGAPPPDHAVLNTNERSVEQVVAELQADPGSPSPSRTFGSSWPVLAPLRRSRSTTRAHRTGVGLVPLAVVDNVLKHHI
jgi:hypothetical protein